MSKHTMTITKAQRDWIEAHAESGHLSGAREVPGGFEIDLDDDVWEVLKTRGGGDANEGLRAIITAGTGRLQ